MVTLGLQAHLDVGERESAWVLVDLHLNPVVDAEALGLSALVALEDVGEVCGQD